MKKKVESEKEVKRMKNLNDFQFNFESSIMFGSFFI